MFSGGKDAHTPTTPLLPVTSEAQPHRDRSSTKGASESGVSARFRTRRGKWVTLFIVFASACVVSGPVTSWATFEPYLGDLHVFNSTRTNTTYNLDLVYVLGNSAGMALSLPVGMLYDLTGPAAMGLIGGISATIGLAALAFGISSRHYNWFLFWGYPLCTTGGQTTAMAILGWQWLLPESGTIVAAMMGIAVAVSDTLAIAGSFLLQNTQMSLETLFFALAALSAVGSLITFFLAPGFAENKRHYEISTGVGKNERRPGICVAFKASWYAFKLHPGAVIIMQISLCALWSSVMYSSRRMENYYDTLFDQETTDFLLENVFPIAQGVGGTIGMAVGGYVCKRIGLVKFNMLVLLLQILVSIVNVVPSYWAQVMWMFGWSLLVYVPTVIYLRFAIRYAPFEAFATFQGILATIMVIPQVLFSESFQSFMERIAHDHFFYAFTTLNAFMVATNTAVCAYWLKYPPPKPASVSVPE